MTNPATNPVTIEYVEEDGRRYAIRNGHRFEVGSLSTDDVLSTKRKVFEPEFAKLPFHWIQALRQAKNPGPAPNAGPPMGDFPVLFGPAPNAGPPMGDLRPVAIGRLEAPMDFMNSVRVLLPMELWGRCVLCVWAPPRILPGRRPMTRTEFGRYLGPNFPLNASIKLLSVGLPGLEKSSVTPFM